MKIAIIGAMPEELASLRARTTLLVSPYQPLSEPILHQKVLLEERSYEGIPFILVESGIGKVNASMATTLLIQKYSPDAIINAGTAGALHRDVSIGDVAISSVLTYSDVDATCFDYVLGQVPRMPESYPADPKLLAAAYKLTKQDSRTYFGQTVTSDSFMSNPARAKWIRETYRGAISADMESTAIAQVAYGFEIPFINLRIISDIAGVQAAKSFDNELNNMSEQVMSLALLLLQEIS